MATRLLRDLTDSEAFNAVSYQAQSTFVRCINKADDYGILVKEFRRLRASLFPTKVDEVREADLSRWIAECEKAVLVRSYTVLGREYIQIAKWRQRLRLKNLKHPLPPWGKDHPDDVDPLEGTRLTHDGHVSDTRQHEANAHAHANAHPPKPPASGGAGISESSQKPKKPRLRGTAGDKLTQARQESNG